VPKDLAEDSMFPFKGADSVFVKVSFKLGDNKLMWKDGRSWNKRRLRAKYSSASSLR